MGAENEAKGGGKRKRCYLPHNKPVRKKGPGPLRPGFQGFFITCDGGREVQAAHEALDVLDTFLEELIEGKDPGSRISVIPEKPLNKKITFSYSDSSDDEVDGEEGINEEENHLERTVVNGANEGIAVDEVPSQAKKDDQSQNAGSEQTAEDDKLQADCKSEAVQTNDVGSKQITHGDKQSEETEEPPEKKQCSDAKKVEHENNGISTRVPTTEKSVDQLIEAELQELGDKSKRRFAKIDTGCNGVIVIQMRRREGDRGPRDIVQYMMESAAARRKHMSRFLLRVLPVELSCYASEEEISRAMKPLVEKYFPANAEAPFKFAVQYDARANSGIERMKIIDAVAKSVPVPHKVDLKNPEKTIVVQVVKTVCMIGVVEKYKELAKFNFRQLTSSKP